jgi:hypothetical protein
MSYEVGRAVPVGDFGAGMPGASRDPGAASGVREVGGAVSGRSQPAKAVPAASSATRLSALIMLCVRLIGISTLGFVNWCPEKQRAWSAIGLQTRRALAGLRIRKPSQLLSE